MCSGTPAGVVQIGKTLQKKTPFIKWQVVHKEGKRVGGVGGVGWGTLCNLTHCCLPSPAPAPLCLMRQHGGLTPKRAGGQRTGDRHT